MEASRQGSSSRSLAAPAAAAAADGAPTEAAEVVKMRIVDWLREPDERDDQIDGFSSRGLNLCVPSGTALTELLPKLPFRLPKRSPGSRRRSLRLLPFLRCRQKKGKEKEPGEALRKEDGAEKLAPFESKMVEGVDTTEGSLQVAAGRNPDEGSFNLGMGIGMVFILSRWETEVSKMKELRFQMELLLKEIRDEVAKKDVALDIIKSNNNFASSSSDCNENVGKCNIKSFKNHRTVLQMAETDSTAETDSHLNYQIGTENQSMDQLEAELAFELEQLQFNLEGKDSVTLSEREKLACGTTSSSESFEPQEEYQNNHGGVSASELERRLYELIHSRQQERVAELESALELSNKMLIDKEIEVSWWKDTISLLSPRQEEMIMVNPYERDHTSSSSCFDGKL